MGWVRTSLKVLGRASVGVLLAGAGGWVYTYATSDPFLERAGGLEPLVAHLEEPPSRQEQIDALMRASSASKASIKRKEGGNPAFDVVVIGGGINGAGIALDCATRGLSVALLEKDDFCAWSSLRSTKRILGGLQLLETGVWKRSGLYLQTAFDAMQERAIVFRQIPGYWLGLKIYDLFAAAGHASLGASQYMSVADSLRSFSLLTKVSSNGKPLRGSLRFFEGQIDDARFGLSVALTAALFGAVVANHTAVSAFVKDENGHVCGVEAVDSESGQSFEVRSRLVVNATGMNVDAIRQLGNDHNPEQPQKLVRLASRGSVQIVLPKYFSPDSTGLMVRPCAGTDDRVLYVMPWQGETLAGCTDSSATQSAEQDDMTMTESKLNEDDVGSTLDSVSRILEVDIRKREVKSAWRAVSPVAIVEEKSANNDEKTPTQGSADQTSLTLETSKNEEKPSENKSEGEKKLQTGGPVDMDKAPQRKNKQKKQELAPPQISHRVIVSDDRLVNVVGGSWATYRRVAEDTLEKLLELDPSLQRSAGPCRTRSIELIGSHDWDASYFSFLMQNYEIARYPTLEGRRLEMTEVKLDVEVARHLSASYGNLAFRVAQLAAQGFGRLLVEGHPVLEAEVVYAVQHEMATTVVDVLARRTDLALLDPLACDQALPSIVQLMGEQLKWSSARRTRELAEAKEFLAMLTPPASTS